MFYNVAGSPQLMSSLQRWILSKAEEIFKAGTNSESASLDILEWAPMESMVKFLGFRLYKMEM
jgi:hypothetical protein